MVEPLLTVREAAAHLSLSVSSLNKRRLTGDTPPFVKLGKSVRYRRSDLDFWTEKHLQKSTSEPLQIAA